MSQDLRQLPTDSPLRDAFEKSKPSFNFDGFYKTIRDDQESARQDTKVASAQPTTEYWLQFCQL